MTGPIDPEQFVKAWALGYLAAGGDLEADLAAQAMAAYTRLSREPNLPELESYLESYRLPAVERFGDELRRIARE